MSETLPIIVFNQKYSFKKSIDFKYKFKYLKKVKQSKCIVEIIFKPKNILLDGTV